MAQAADWRKRALASAGGRDEKLAEEEYNYVLTVLIRVDTHPKESFEQGTPDYGRWDHRRDSPSGLMQTHRLCVRFHVSLLEVHKG